MHNIHLFALSKFNFLFYWEPPRDPSHLHCDQRLFFFCHLCHDLHPGAVIFVLKIFMYACITYINPNPNKNKMSGYNYYSLFKCRCYQPFNKKLVETGSGGEVIPIVVNFKVFSIIINTATAQRNDCFTQANRPTNVYKSWTGAPAGYGRSIRNQFN